MACRTKRHGCMLQKEPSFETDGKPWMLAIEPCESDAVLGAMRQVALAGGRAISHADTVSIQAAARYLMRRRDVRHIGGLPAVEPPDLLSALKANAELARD